MGADNGVYVSRWINRLSGKHEFRVTTAQAIENCFYSPNMHFKLTQAYQVFWFYSSEVFEDEKEAFGRAVDLYMQIIHDPIFPICVYGIQYLQFDSEFPLFSLKEAERIIDNPPENKKQSDLYKNRLN